MTLISKPLRLVIGGILILSIALIAGYYAMLSLAQERILAAALSYLSSSDTENFSYRRVSFKAGEVIFFGLSFDEYGFNTIDRVTISYEPLAFLRHQKIESATLLHPVVTLESGEIINGTKLSYQDLPVELLKIEKGEIVFLTKVFGGIIVNYSANLKKQSDGYMVSAEYSSGQPHMKFSGAFQGAIFPERGSDLRLPLDGVEINTPDIHIRRSNGEINIALNPENYLESTVRFQATAGGARLYGYPWVNSNFSFEGTRHVFSFLSTGKTGDDAQSEFTYSFDKNIEGKINSSGAVFSDDGGAFYRYIIRNNPDLLHPDDQPQVMGMDEVNLNFELYPRKRLLVYYLPVGKSGETLQRREILIPSSVR